ncbi:6-phosphofructokinase [Alteracholeplasma palmae J233]|uniref:ATP-dependent 6-phosphofructokinase n=1 Tax=Alteracholeplasma palmae (strain ATCC 49389 / J233) TaxID=1318466 RepID=U4KLL1_ALTPJ|nr:6-phosphofructokinase [Alteracholeplasma palmae]CCV64757.1 6-phosphofructokinase [Alteracholeplasma palmae J233]
MKIAVLTSGGDAPGMNAAIRAVVRASLHYGFEVYGVLDGYKGLLEDRMILLNHDAVSGLLTKGGTFLGTARLPEFKDEAVREVACKNLKERGIEALIVIGGDGSYRGALALGKLGIKCIGIPGTIDNDIVGTDFTIGFNTALTTIVDAIDKLRDTSTSHQRCSIVEVMGRRSGDLALYAGICGGAEFIITPENPINKKKIIERMKEFKETNRRHAIIVVTENQFNVHELAKEITEASGFASRATVLGYIQRGGQPVPEDRILGSRMGSYAVDLLSQNIYGCCVGIRDSRMIHLPFVNVLDQERPKNDLYPLLDKIS